MYLLNGDTAMTEREHPSDLSLSRALAADYKDEEDDRKPAEAASGSARLVQAENIRARNR
jgi:hypothetical protein